MKVVVCWAGLQGYVAACLRALNQVPSVDLHVLHLDFQDVPVQEELLHEVSNRRLMAAASNLEIPDLVSHRNPDVVLICGWFYPQYRRLVHTPALRGAKFVLGMDTPWTGAWPQRVNQIRLRGFMRRMDKVVVAGPRSAECARRLGVPRGRIANGLYGFDYTAFRERGRRLDAAPDWPKRFLFAGRYAHVKGIDILVDAYRRYRARVAAPWPLDCCGTGPESSLITGEGIHDLGYVLPSELPGVFADHGTFLMPSREEPWGVAIGEAAATGLPLICTDVCGATIDILRSYYNGIAIPPGDAAALADAMVWMHQNHGRMREFGERSRQLAHPFSAETWAQRMHAYFASVLAARESGAAPR
ncbi:MAG: glycosyltransferase family 4 protein [Vicinamibacterales bacterium]|jgi:glycosyltransferase involved in cell wall biosynthesis